MDRLHAQFFELVFKMAPNTCTHDCLTCFYVVAHQFEKKTNVKLMLAMELGAIQTIHHHVHLFHTQHEQGTQKTFCMYERNINSSYITMTHAHMMCTLISDHVYIPAILMCMSL